MPIRGRLIALVMGVLCLGGVVAMFPAGGSAQDVSIQAGKPTTTTTPATPRCTDAKQLQTDSIALVKPYLSRSALTTYKAKLTELVNTACDVNGTCTTLTTQVAQLRSIRGVSLPPAQEITLTGKEDTFLATYCAS